MRQPQDYRHLPKPAGERSWKRILAWVLGGAFVLFVLFTVLGGILSECTDLGEPEASPEAIPPTAVSTAAPTIAPPTPTPQPTPTPTVTPTPLPVSKCETSEARAYLAKQGPLASRIAENMRDVSELFTAASSNVTLIWDLDWQLQTAAVLVDINTNADEILALKAPTVFSAAHSDLKQSANNLKRFVDLTVKGIDEVDVDILLRANESLMRASTLTTSATDKLKQAC